MSYTRFASGLVFPLHERLKGHDSVAVRQRLERSQWLEPQAIAAEQAERLRGFLATIGERVPYWRALFRERGFDPQTVRSVADLQALHLQGLQAIGRPPLRLLQLAPHGHRVVPLQALMQREQRAGDEPGVQAAHWEISVGWRSAAEPAAWFPRSPRKMPSSSSTRLSQVLASA